MSEHHIKQKIQMITLSNGFSFEEIIASGSLAFDGKGWFWERPLVWVGLLKPELCPVVIKTLTEKPRKGNLRWWKPWTCVALIKGGAVNKVGLTNPGIDRWCKKIGPKIDFQKYSVVGSIWGNKEELVRMILKLNHFDFEAVEVNYSCPNTEHGLAAVQGVVESVCAVANASRHPIILKVSVAQDYLAIAQELEGVIEAISINSVPFELVFPDEDSPLYELEQKVGGGGGGVSGKPAQKLNWKAVRELVQQGCVPVIAPSVMEYKDMTHLMRMGASAVSFGTIHMASYPVWLKPWTIFTNPLKPTRFIERKRKENNKQ